MTTNANECLTCGHSSAQHDDGGECLMSRCDCILFEEDE